ncbi:unnamed protein product [Effrenium voratum]|nr:unnamed protein product [Effrenium voratum]
MPALAPCLGLSALSDEAQEAHEAEPDKVKAEESQTTQDGAEEQESQKQSEPEAAVEEDNLTPVLKLMSAGKFEDARRELMKMLKDAPEDPVVLHNLGVAFTEEGKFQDAEEKFLQAWESQKKADKVNYATMFGLATVLTEQGETGKLMQAEALFHDFLEMAISKEEKAIPETYRGFVGLADNLERQKRWAEASQAWQNAVDMAEPMPAPDPKTSHILLDQSPAVWSEQGRLGGSGDIGRAKGEGQGVAKNRAKAAALASIHSGIEGLGNGQGSPYQGPFESTGILSFNLAATGDTAGPQRRPQPQRR